MKKDTVTKVKFKRLQRQLRLPLWQTMGLLEALWHCTITNAPDGNIGRLSNDDIAAAIEWEDDADNLINALVQCGWLDDDEHYRLIVHDWSQHVPTYLKGAYDKHGKRFADVAAKQRAKHDIEHGAKQDAKDNALHGATGGCSYPILSQPSQTQPIQTQSIEPSGSGTDAGDIISPSEFLATWNRLPGVVPAREMNDKRQASLKARLLDRKWAWQEAIAKFPLKLPSSDPGGWRPDIDWFLRPDTVTKILEGKYDWEKKNGRQPTTASESAKPIAKGTDHTIGVGW